MAKLCPSNVDPADGALEELKRVIDLIRSRWLDVGILVRGDSAYAREEIMAWCESQVGVDYVFGLSKNPRLMTMTLETQRQARVSYEHTLQTVENFLETLFHPEEEFQEVEWCKGSVCCHFDSSQKSSSRRTLSVSRGGQPRSNANGVATSTLLGASLVEQVSTLKLESNVL